MNDFRFNRILNYVFVLLFFICLSSVANAQVSVTGKITDKKDSKPVVGATVQLKNSPDVATVTDANGNFTLRVPSLNATLEVSFVGYATQEIRLNNRSNVSVSLEEGQRAMDDVVVIGYQTVQRRKTTAAVATVQGKEIENIPYPTFDQMLQGRVAGLNILSVSGEPGANNIVNIRGNSSVDASGNGISTPLYVIDGIVMDVSDVRTAYGNSNPLQAINPNDIESVDVLKDASAAAIYGARAANGVIIIKTKRPKTGRPQFRASAYVGVSTKPAMKKVLVGQEERRLKMGLLYNGGTYTQRGNISQFLTDSLNPAFNNNTDWQGLFLKDAVIRNVDLNLGAATETFAYRISLNQYVEDGIMRGYSITRSTPRLFLSLKPYKGIEVTTDLFMGLTKALHGPGNSNPYPFTVWAFPSSFWAITDQVKANYEGRNEKVRDDDRTFSVNGNTRLIATLIQNLQFTSSLSYNINNARRDYLMHKSVTTNNRSDAIHRSINSRRWEIENYLTYTKDIKHHTITALLGQGAEQNTNTETSLRANGIPFDAIQMVQGVAPGPSLTGSTGFEERTRLSMFARVGYDYKGKYGIDGSYRRDASSRYSPGSRWGAFPAVSVRWNVSEEAFFSSLTNVINFFKLRASYGLTGRDPGGYYAQYNQLTSDVRWQGSSLGSGATANVITYNGTTAVVPNYNTAAPAANISWEKTPQMNLGLDASFLRDRFALNLDYYIKDSREIIFSVPVPITSGYSLAQNNFVDIRNRGVEITLNTNNLSNHSKFRWRTTFNVAFNKNFVTKLPAGNRDFVFGPPWLQRTLTIGQPLYAFLAWRVPGVYSTIDDVPVDPLTGQRIRWESSNNFFNGGDGMKTDVNGDYNITALDKVNMGDPQTRVYGGLINNLTYKGFSLSVLTSFVSGRKLWNGYLSDKLNGASRGQFTDWGPISGPAAEFNGLNFWYAPGDVAGLPSLFAPSVDNWHIAQSLFIEDASFVRIKNVNIGYMLPDKIAHKIKMKSIRIYSVMDNLKVFYNATVPDPELVSPDGYTNGNDYPLPKKFTFGLDIQL
jgi:TonB-linked SusC/RagA family outer membrane protein